MECDRGADFKTGSTKTSGPVLVIAEKPSVARSIAGVLGANEKKEGYLEGNNYTVTWCIGHLVEPLDPEGYDEKYKKWSYEDLPIIPGHIGEPDSDPDSYRTYGQNGRSSKTGGGWKYRAKQDTKKQYDIVARLLNDQRFSEVVCATDAGREGETIFRKVYYLSGSRLPIKRLWISSMEDSVIREGFANLRSGEEYENLFQAGICREKADWLVGMNGTRLFTELYGFDDDNGTPGKHTVYHIGRVQTPTLAIVVEREESIRGFVKEPYYTVHILSDGLDAVSDKYKSREEAVALADLCLGGRCLVEHIMEEAKTKGAPKLYDLTSLQRDANRLFGFTALQTSEYTQSLYEKKLCTYPRTDSRYLTEDMGETATEIIEAVSTKFFPVGYGFQPKINALLNSSKVSDHHAIIPTMEITGLNMADLPDGEQKILLLTANRLICAVSDPYRYKKVYVRLDCNHNSFEATGTKVIDPGYRKYEDMLKESLHMPEGEEVPDDTDDRRESDSDMLDRLREGMEITPYELAVKTGFTTPPKPYTEDTLLKYMENAGAKGFEEEVERKGLGTPATRAEIIDKLCRSGYLRREKKNLRATALGEKLIHLVPEVVKSVDLSVEWENNLTRINKGEMDPDAFISEIEAMVRELVEDYRYLAEEMKARRKIIPFTAEYFGECPHCGGEVTKGKFGVYCRNKCGMKLDIAYGKHLTDDQIRKLLKGESIRVSLRSRKGKDFDAILKPKGIKEFSYERDGKQFSGFQFDFDMAFPG
ncbi:MAG: DNA topoisomerase III [Lachnospiraceae bacterium]|nr:DNA topoisomerase III [Lachnospiraceae bacterium]